MSLTLALVRRGCAALLLFALAPPALAQIAPARGNPTRADVLADMKLVNKARPGLGDDKGVPLMTPFALPPGVRIVGDAVGADENGKCPGDGDFGTIYRDVQVCLPVCYVGNNVTNAVFPPGLVITTASEGFQNGLLVERTVVAVPPTTCNTSAPPYSPGKKPVAPPKNAFWIKLSAFCVNESQNPASSEGRYSLGGVAADPELLALSQFLAGRDLGTPQANKVAQSAIYSITERKGLTWQDRKDLYALPLKR
jgi:hypothetical protein